MSAHNHPADDDDQDLHEPWQDHYSTPSPDLNVHPNCYYELRNHVQ